MARRTIAVSATGERFPELIAAVRQAVQETDAPALWIVVADRISELLAQVGALPGAAPALVVVDSLALGVAVDVMRGDGRVIALIDAAEGAAAVLALADRLIAPGATAPPVSYTVVDAASKSAVIHELRAAAIAAGLGGARVDAVEQCADELLTNALYAAPIDEAGTRVFAAHTPRQRLDLRTQHEVAVGVLRDGDRFVLTVRDAFGSLDRARVLERLHAASHDRDVVEHKAAGAGLGFFLIANESNALTIEIVPGASTTITCAFEPGRAGPATRFALWVRPPAAQRAHARVFQTAAVQRRKRARVLWIVASVLATVLVAGVALLQPLGPVRLAVFTSPPDAVVEIDGWVAARDGDGLAFADPTPFSSARVHVYRRGFVPASIDLRSDSRVTSVALAPVATLVVESEPSGATVEIAGKVVGTTPAALTSLQPGEHVVVAFTQSGYVRATAELVVPARSETTRHVQTLARDPAFVRVKLVTDPPGARVAREGEAPTIDPTYTPVEVMVPKGKVTRFILAMPGRTPLDVATGPDTADGAEVGGPLLTRSEK